MDGEQERLVFGFMDRYDRIARPGPMSRACVEPLGKAQELLRQPGDDPANTGRPGGRSAIPRRYLAELQTKRRLFQHTIESPKVIRRFEIGAD